MFHWLKRLFCEHDWEHYGAGLDDLVRCAKCAHIKPEAPGDICPW